MKLDRKARAAFRVYVRTRDQIAEIYNQQNTSKLEGIFAEIVKIKKQRSIQALIVFLKRVGLKKGKEIIDANIDAWRKEAAAKAKERAKANYKPDPEILKLQEELKSLQELQKQEVSKENLDKSGEVLNRVMAGLHNNILKFAQKVETLKGNN